MAPRVQPCEEVVDLVDELARPDVAIVGGPGSRAAQDHAAHSHRVALHHAAHCHLAGHAVVHGYAALGARDGWIRRAELEPLGAEDGAGLDPATVDETLQPGVCFGRFRVS
jgi:hypothetical protein